MDWLAAPVTCPGLLERLAIGAARLWRTAPLGLWLLRANGLLIVAALVAVGRVAYAATGAGAIAAAVTLAFAVQPNVEITLSGFDPLAVAVAGLTILWLWRRATTRIWWGLLLTAAIAPRLALPSAALAGWQVYVSAGSRWRRSILAVASSIGLLTIVAGLTLTMPGAPPWIDSPGRSSCLLPALAAGWTSRAASALSNTIASAGAFACSLAALGVFSLRASIADSRAWPVLAYVAASAAMSAFTSVDAEASRMLAPVLVAFWVAIAFGAAELLRASGQRAAGRVAAGALVVLLPAVSVMATSGRAGSRSPGLARSDAVRFGHDRMTFEGLRRTLQVLPDRSAIVSEDATTDVLLRALDGTWQRSGKALQLVSPKRESVAAAIQQPSTRVFALPRAQTELRYLGFRLTDAALPGVSGLAEVQLGGACDSLDTAWRSLAGISRTTLLVLVAKSGTEGAVALYAGSDHPIAPRPLDWPSWAIPGFIVTSYERDAGDRARLERDILQDALPRDHPVLNETHVVRLGLWKMPASPRLLPVDLGAPAPSIGVARATPGIAVDLCPGFPYPVQPIVLPH